MIYPYACDECELEWEVIKSVKDYDKPEKCNSCGKEGRKVFYRPQISVDKFERGYHPAFGKEIKNKRQLKYEVEKNRLIEVGNEDVFKESAKVQKELEAKRKEGYDQALKEALSGN